MTYQTGELVLDKYRIETFIGKGAFGDVYRVNHLNLNVSRALKILRHDGIGVGSIDYDNGRQRFKLEAQLGARLNNSSPHPCLLQVYDFIETNEVLVLEMEYAAGGNLADRILFYKEKGIPFPREKVLRLAYEIASGLAILHDSEIVHRDLKPANILFDQQDHARIADLGLAQVPGGPILRSILSSPNPHPGTPGYMSPEQRNSSALLLPSSDVYTLGLVLFEILTERNYYNVRPRTRLSDLIPGIRPSLNNLLARMLSEFPGDRPSDGTELAVELYRELEAEEQSQRAIQAEKRREQEEWERLKNAELSRREKEDHYKQELPVGENKKATAWGLRETDKSDKLEDKIQELELQGRAAILSKDWRTARQAVKELNGLGEEGKSSAVSLQADIRPPLIWKRYWWVGIIFLLVIGLIPLFIGLNLGEPGTKTPVDTTNSVEQTNISGLTSTQINEGTAVLPIQPSIPIAFPTLIEPLAVPTSTQTFTSTQFLIATMIPTAFPPIQKLELINVLKNPGFEKTSDWAIKVGDSHILGEYSSDWASEGTQSYKLSLFGDRVYEYCFTPGMRTSVNQSVDLTNVDEILFDINIRPPAITEGFHGVVVKTNAVAFVDSGQVYLSADDVTGELLDQKIALNKEYSGKHEIKFGLMVSSKFCVKGRSEAESLAVFVDNIRLLRK